MQTEHYLFSKPQSLHYKLVAVAPPGFAHVIDALEAQAIGRFGIFESRIIHHQEQLKPLPVQVQQELSIELFAFAGQEVDFLEHTKQNEEDILHAKEVEQRAYLNQKKHPPRVLKADIRHGRERVDNLIWTLDRFAQARKILEYWIPSEL